jgi:glycine/D-amino acid oxidase-like deaminating enzyme/nitrite reductase/ring-hydroxylating ferredoxin subunit
METGVFMEGKKNDFRDPPSPYWLASIAATDYPDLDRDISVDVAIVGGGIVGITAAYLLKEEGLKVAVIEADRILQGTTGHSTAKITSQHGLIYARLQKEMGEELARQYADANQSAIGLIAELSRKHHIDCDFSWRPAYVFTQSERYITDIEDEARVAAQLGIEAEYLREIPLPFAVQAALRFDGQAQFHPVKFLQALAEKIPGQGSAIFEQTAAVHLEEADGAVVVARNGHKVTASRVIIASHYPFFDGGGLYFSRIYQDRSYIVAVKIREAFPEGTFINAESPTRSLRSQNDENGELVLVAGEHHKSGHGGNTDTYYQNLVDFAAQTFTVEDVLYRWSTQDCMTVDGVPYVGNLTPQSPHIYVATGFGKWGITNGTAAAMVLKDLIVKGDNPWAQVYNPARLTLPSVKSWFIQNAHVAKDLITGKLQGLQENTEIPRGEARLVEIDGQRIGAYRDEEGQVHCVDTTCTHLGCELRWNAAEKSWDCPCHGSRFTYEGENVEGPAFLPLHHLEEEANQVEARIFS